MKILIIPDIHCRHELARSIFEKYVNEVDHVVFLGDYFDAFNDTIYSNSMTANFIKEIIDNPKVTLLFGNHDISYRYNNQTSHCPGYTKEKSYAINDILTQKDWDKFKYFVEFDGNVFCHAGFSNKLIIQHDILYDNRSLSEIAEKTDECYRKNEEANLHFTPIYTAIDAKRSSRGGDFGGILWNDWDYLSLVSNINQIVGHTPQFFPKVKFKINDRKWQEVCLKHDKDYAKKIFKFDGEFWHLPEHFNLALDTHLKYSAILKNGKKLKIIENKL